MSEVRVEIDGRSYRMACGEGEEERLASLAAELDGLVAALRETLGELGDRRIMVMTALTVLDRLRRSETAAAELKERVATLERSREEAVLTADAEDEPLVARIEALTAVVERVTATLRAGTRRTQDGGPEGATFGRAPVAAADRAALPEPKQMVPEQPSSERQQISRPRRDDATGATGELLSPEPQQSVPEEAPSERQRDTRPRTVGATGDLDRVVPSFLKRP